VTKKTSVDKTSKTKKIINEPNNMLSEQHIKKTTPYKDKNIKLYYKRGLRYLASRGFTPSRILLAAILAIAFGVRYPQTLEGLPYGYHWDEPLVIHETMEMMRDNDFIPDYWSYPHGYMYIQLAPACLGYLESMKTGHIKNPWQLLTRYETEYRWTVSCPPIYRWGRLMTLFFGLVVVAELAWLMARLLGRKAGLIVAGLVALHPLMIIQSGKITIDMPATAFALAAILAAYKVLASKNRSARWLFAAGVFAGIAAGVKMTFYPAIIAPILAFLLHPRRRSLLDFSILLVPAGAAGAFVAVSPGAILDLTQFLHGVGFALRSFATEGIEGMRLQTTGQRFRASLWMLKGSYPLLALSGAALAGFGVFCAMPWVASWRRAAVGTGLAATIRIRGLAILILTGLAFWKAQMNYALMFSRYMVPVIALTILPLAALALSRGGLAIGSRRLRTRLAVTAIVAFIALGFATAAFKSSLELLKPDPRFLATQWLNEHAPQGAQVGIPGELHFSRIGLREDIKIIQTNMASVPFLLAAQNDINLIVIPNQIAFASPSKKKQFADALSHINETQRVWTAWILEASFEGWPMILDAPATWPAVKILKRNSDGGAAAPRFPAIGRNAYLATEAIYESPIESSSNPGPDPGIALRHFCAGRIPVHLSSPIKSVKFMTSSRPLNGVYPTLSLALSDEHGNIIAKTMQITPRHSWFAEDVAPLQAPAGRYYAVLDYHATDPTTNTRPVLLISSVVFE
jgi:hypothetical protein